MTLQKCGRVIHYVLQFAARIRINPTSVYIRKA